MSPPLLLGIEIGGTKLQLGLGRGDGRIRALLRRAVDLSAGAEGILAAILAEVDPLLIDLGASRQEVAAVGIGFGGPVDAGRGVVTVSNQIEGWEGFPLADWVRDRLGIPVVSLHNDADAAALGEACFGAGGGHSPILYVQIGSGIGGGLVFDGQIYRGAGAGAVEIGQLRMTQIVEGALNRTTTLEGMASGWSIGENARRTLRLQIASGLPDGTLLRLADGDPERVTAATVAEAARLGDALAASILDQATEAMGRGLAHAVALLAPRRIILGGGVSQIGEELWFAPIRQELDRCTFPPFLGTFDLVPAALGEEVVVHGALALARAAWHSAHPLCS